MSETLSYEELGRVYENLVAYRGYLEIHGDESLTEQYNELVGLLEKIYRILKEMESVSL